VPDERRAGLLRRAMGRARGLDYRLFVVSTTAQGLSALVGGRQ
jgi:hypothetical protein